MRAVPILKKVPLVFFLTCCGVFLAGCSAAPLQPFSRNTAPLMLAPAIQAEDQDRRGRFREIFCAVLDRHQGNDPGHPACDQALATVGDEPPGRDRPVFLGRPRHPLTMIFIPGLGWDCIAHWLNDSGEIAAHLQAAGFDMIMASLDGLAASGHNAALIRDTIMNLPASGTDPDLVLVGYSKGAVDALTAVGSYPELRPRIAAVVSLAGAVGGSPLANQASEGLFNLMEYFPGSTCRPATSGRSALQDLHTDTRKNWLANHPLPDDVRSYSLITFPEPRQVSRILKRYYRKLAQVDPRNDGQVIFYDQFIPGSQLVAYLNADHLAVAVPIERSHDIIGSLLFNRNAFPRKALFEALLRLIDEDLQSAGEVPDAPRKKDASP